MTENQNDQPAKPFDRNEFQVNPECASTNFFWNYGKVEVFSLQTTLRGVLSDEDIRAHIETVRAGLGITVGMGGHAKTQTPKGEAYTAPVVSDAERAQASGKGNAVPVPPPPPVMPGHASSGANQESHCSLIKLVSSYTGNKPQIEFECDGLEHALKYTRTPQDMAKLLAPIGYTQAHITDPSGAFRLNQKYGVDCIVVWNETSKEGKTYKNVISVRPNA